MILSCGINYPSSARSPHDINCPRIYPGSIHHQDLHNSKLSKALSAQKSYELYGNNKHY